MKSRLLEAAERAHEINLSALPSSSALILYRVPAKVDWSRWYDELLKEEGESKFLVDVGGQVPVAYLREREGEARARPIKPLGLESQIDLGPFALGLGGRDKGKAKLVKLATWLVRGPPPSPSHVAHLDQTKDRSEEGLEWRVWGGPDGLNNRKNNKPRPLSERNIMVPLAQAPLQPGEALAWLVDCKAWCRDSSPSGDSPLGFTSMGRKVVVSPTTPTTISAEAIKPPKHKPYAMVLVDGKYVKLHRAIWAAFHPDEPLPPVVRHLNDDPTDNSLSNLAPGTQRENLGEDARANRRLKNLRPVILSSKKEGPKKEGSEGPWGFDSIASAAAFIAGRLHAQGERVPASLQQSIGLSLTGKVKSVARSFTALPGFFFSGEGEGGQGDHLFTEQGGPAGGGTRVAIIQPSSEDRDLLRRSKAKVPRTPGEKAKGRGKRAKGETPQQEKRERIENGSGEDGS